MSDNRFVEDNLYKIIRSKAVQLETVVIILRKRISVFEIFKFDEEFKASILVLERIWFIIIYSIFQGCKEQYINHNNMTIAIDVKCVISEF